MMVGMALFVDNLERAKYDIPLVIQNWDQLADHIFLFSGTSPTTSILNGQFASNDRISVIQLDVHIDAPHDIPIAVNSSIERCYAVGVDALIFCHADIYVTPKGMELISSLVKRKDQVNIGSMHVQLYNVMWMVYGELVIQYRDRPSISPLSGDGNLSVIGGKPYIDDDSLLLDMGYLTVSQYRNKMYNHNFIWPDPYKVKVSAAFDKGLDDGLRMAYSSIRRFNGKPLEPINPETYHYLLDRYNAWEEYDHCVQVMREINESVC